jgi:hypothetical protein
VPVQYDLSYFLHPRQRDPLSLLYRKRMIRRLQFHAWPTTHLPGMDVRFEIQSARVSRQGCAEPTEVGRFSLPPWFLPEFAGPFDLGVTCRPLLCC